MNKVYSIGFALAIFYLLIGCSGGADMDASASSAPLPSSQPTSPSGCQMIEHCDDQNQGYWFCNGDQDEYKPCDPGQHCDVVGEIVQCVLNEAGAETDSAVTLPDQDAGPEEDAEAVCICGPQNCPANGDVKCLGNQPMVCGALAGECNDCASAWQIMDPACPSDTTCEASGDSYLCVPLPPPTCHFECAGANLMSICSDGSSDLIEVCSGMDGDKLKYACKTNSSGSSGSCETCTEQCNEGEVMYASLASGCECAKKTCSRYTDEDPCTEWVKGDYYNCPSGTFCHHEHGCIYDAVLGCD